MVSLFRSDRDKDKTKSQSRASDNGGTPDRPPPRRSEDGGLGEASSSATTSPTPPPPVSTPSKYRILRRKASVKSPSRGTAPAPVASSPPPLPPPRLASPLSTDGVRRDSTEPESSTSASRRSGPSEPPTASTFASLASQQDDAVSAAAAAAALGLTDDFIASPSGRRISEASKREGRVFGLPPRLPDLSTDDEAGPVGWRGAGGSLDMGSRTDNTLFDPDWTPKPPSLDPAAAGGVTFPTALSPPRRTMPRSPRPPPRSEAIHSPRKRLTDSDSSSPQLSPAFAAAKGSPSRSGPSNDGIRFSTAEWLSRPPNKASSGRKGSMGGEDPFSRTAAGSPPPSSSSTSRRSGSNHGRSTSVSALSAMAKRNLGLHDDSGTSSESAEEFGSDVGAPRLLSPVGYTAPSPLGGYEVEVSCADTRGTNDEIKWEITVRRRPASSPGGDAADGIHRPAPLSASSPLQLGPSGHAIARAPASASSLNLSLALDQPSGKLVFISIPMALDPAASTPRSSGQHRRNGSRASPSPRPTSSSARSSPVPDGLPPRMPSRLSSAAAAAAVPAAGLDADSSRPSTPPPAPHPASTATLPVTPVSKRREGSHIYDRAFASPRTPGGAPHTPSRVLHYISPAAEASTLSPAGRGVSLQHSALSKRRPSGSIANAARRSSLDGISGGVGGGVGGGTGLSQAAPMSPSAPGQRRSRIVSAEELAGGLFAAGTVDQFSEQLEEPLSIRLKDP